MIDIENAMTLFLYTAKENLHCSLVALQLRLWNSSVLNEILATAVNVCTNEVHWRNSPFSTTMWFSIQYQQHVLLVNNPKCVGSNCTLHSLANAVISHILIFVNLIDAYVRFRGFKVAHLEIQIVTLWIIG